MAKRRQVIHHHRQPTAQRLSRNHSIIINHGWMNHNTCTTVYNILCFIVNIAKPINGIRHTKPLGLVFQISLVSTLSISYHREMGFGAGHLHHLPNIKKSIYPFLLMESATENDIPHFRHAAMRNLIHIYTSIKCEQSIPPSLGKMYAIRIVCYYKSISLHLCQHKQYSLIEPANQILQCREFIFVQQVLDNKRKKKKMNRKKALLIIWVLQMMILALLVVLFVSGVIKVSVFIPIILVIAVVFSAATVFAVRKLPPM